MTSDPAVNRDPIVDTAATVVVAGATSVEIPLGPVSVPVAEEVPPAPPQPRAGPYRALALWFVIAALLVTAGITSVGSVNRDVYGAGNFVHEYLNALNRQDATAALETPGVTPSAAELTAMGLSADAGSVLLRDSMASSIRNIVVTGDDEVAPGRHVVTVEYLLAKTGQHSVFHVEKTEPRYGVFNSWRFARSPLAAVDLTVLHETQFAVDGLTLDTRQAQTTPKKPQTSARYLVFSPGSYTFSHSSRLLTADPVTATVTTGLSTTKITVDALANEEFVTAVQTEVDSYLDACASQEVLLPAGCPFGQFIENRLVGLPSWKIQTYPPVTLAPASDHWEMPETKGVAHLTGEVLSLFDGTISDLDDKIPFTLSLTATIRPDGSLDIRVQ